MSSSGYTAEVTNLSSKATKKDVYNFFSFCGPVQNVEILRHSKHDYRAYVTFKDFHALETSILLTGSVIVDQPVEITPHGHYEMRADAAVSSPGEAVVMATEVVKTMAVQGYTLSIGAYQRAKAFDEAYRVSAKAAAAVAQVSQRIGLTDKIKAVDEKYKVYDRTSMVARTASSAAITASSAASTVVNSTIVAKGALMLSDVLGFAAKAAADFGNRNANS